MSTMSSTPLSATSLAVTVAHAVTYLTRPLATRLSSSTFSALQTALEANLAAAFASSWMPHDPTRGSGRRVLSFAPGALPPRPVYKASVAVGIDWTMWSALLGTKEFDLVVDPGSVCLRVPRLWGPPACIPIWTAEEQKPQQASIDFAKIQAQAQARNCGVCRPQPIAAFPAPQPSKTLAQSLAEEDAAEAEEIFTALAAEMREPAWKSPATEMFPTCATAPFGAIGSRSFTPGIAANAGIGGAATGTTSLLNPAAATFLGHSRSSSRSSVTSASTSTSFVSDDTLSSCGSLSSVSTTSSSSDLGAGSTATSLSVPSNKKLGHHGRSRSRVYIDVSKNEVTPYDGGKTTVLTGGVMLGAPPARNSHVGARSKLPRF